MIYLPIVQNYIEQTIFGVPPRQIRPQTYLAIHMTPRLKGLIDEQKCHPGVKSVYKYLFFSIYLSRGFVVIYGRLSVLPDSKIFGKHFLLLDGIFVRLSTLMPRGHINR